jgi:hypothetical protein
MVTQSKKSFSWVVINHRILNDYYPAFLEFQKNMESKRSGEQGKMF